MTQNTDRRLDRLVEFDERSRQYPIRSLLVDQPLRSYTWSCTQHLDQGSEGACVGFSWAHELISRPAPVKGLDAKFARDKIYKVAQTLDEFPGEDYEGTSVLGGVKACQQAGYIGEYRWAFSLEDALRAIAYKGPGVLGTNWYEGMFQVDPKGFVHPTGSVVGGHAILVKAINTTKRRVTLHNSWGSDWGIGGDCYLAFEDFERLLHEDGEFCVPIVRSVVPIASIPTVFGS
jgi:hypothetical protein